MRTAVYLGRRLRVVRGREWGTLVASVNGACAGVVTSRDEDRVLEQLRRDVDGADIARAERPDAYEAHWFAGAPADMQRTADEAFLRIYGWERSVVPDELGPGGHTDQP